MTTSRWRYIFCLDFSLLKTYFTVWQRAKPMYGCYCYDYEYKETDSVNSVQSSREVLSFVGNPVELVLGNKFIVYRLYTIL